jgi:homospermidine synthase
MCNETESFHISLLDVMKPLLKLMVLSIDTIVESWATKNPHITEKLPGVSCGVVSLPED